MSEQDLYKIPFYRVPNASAQVQGSPSHPSIRGIVYFYYSELGTLIVANIIGLPQGAGHCAPDIFGFHIHESGPCSGTADEPFANVGSHYNPHHCPHPAHAGDLPPLFGNNGHAFMSVLTNRFTVWEVIGRSIIVHDAVDDFTTQPSGNSGAMIACGQIVLWR